MDEDAAGEFEKAERLVRRERAREVDSEEGRKLGRSGFGS